MVAVTFFPPISVTNNGYELCISKCDNSLNICPIAQWFKSLKMYLNALYSGIDHFALMHLKSFVTYLLQARPDTYPYDMTNIHVELD